MAAVIAVISHKTKIYAVKEGYVMKVLGIVCSPRGGGNTEILVQEALAAAREAGAETEIVLVKGKNIAPCDSCRTCFETDVCKIEDDMQPIFRQMESADGIVFGSPVYFQNVTAQAKTIIDRTYLFLNKRRLQGKVAAPVLALRRVGAGQARNQLYGYFLAQGMIPVQGAIGYGDVREGVGGSRDLTAMEEARRAGTDVVRLLKRLS
jgi:multimeric flavodoxin WrbA